MEPNSWENVAGNIMPYALAPSNIQEDKQSDTQDNMERLMQRIKKAVLHDIERANSFFTSKVEPILRTRHQIYEADRAYYDKRFSQTAGQSDFVSFDFWSVVQWAIPTIMNAFFGTDEAVVIVGRNEEDVQRADLLKALVQFQLMTQNKGFLVIWDWFTDAFQYNLGAVKIWWERIEEWDNAKIEYCDMSRLMMLQQDQWCEVEYASPPDMFGMSQVEYRIGRLKSNKPIIEPVRVTDLRWSPEAKSLKDANFVAHRQMVTADHLRKQARAGIYDAMAVERAIENNGNGAVIYGAFETELNDELDQLPNDEDTARNLYELFECYIKLDINGDGMLEDALVSVVGEEIIRVTENPYGRVPIFTLSPIRDPFKVLANLSLAEIVGEIQTIKTALMRQLLINTVNTNYQRWFIDGQGIDLKDIQQGRQYIKVDGDPRMKVVAWPQQGVAPWTMNIFENLEGALEQWTGRTRYNQGTDARSLNKTATGISLLQQASEQRIDYIVRVFAETGVSEALRFLVELNQRYIDQPTVIRLKNQMLQVTPDDLKGEYDIDVNTEAGIGRRKQTIENLQYYLTQIAPAGLQLQAITPGEWAKAAQRLLQESGIRDPQSYVLDPDVIKQQFFMALQQQMAMQQAQQLQAAGQAGLEAGKVAGQEALKVHQAQQKALQQQVQAMPNPTQQAAQALRYATGGNVL